MNWFRYIGGVMFSVLALNVVDRVFELWSGQTKDYAICISWFSAKYAAFRRKSKHWLARNQDNVSDWGDMSICGLLFYYKKKGVLVKYKADLIISHWKLVLAII